MIAEFLATFGLLLVIVGCLQHRKSTIAVAVGLYIAGSTCFTSSAAFANPAVTFARVLTDTVAGIRPLDTVGFVVSEVLGGVSAVILFVWMMGPRETRLPELISHTDPSMAEQQAVKERNAARRQVKER